MAGTWSKRRLAARRRARSSGVTATPSPRKRRPRACPRSRARVAGVPSPGAGGGGLVCGGWGDGWYTTAKFDADIGRLRVAGASVTPLAFDGGHEWSDAVNQAAGAFLHAVLAR